VHVRRFMARQKVEEKKLTVVSGASGSDPFYST